MTRFCSGGVPQRFLLLTLLVFGVFFEISLKNRANDSLVVTTLNSASSIKLSTKLNFKNSLLYVAMNEVDFESEQEEDTQEENDNVPNFLSSFCKTFQLVHASTGLLRVKNIQIHLNNQSIHLLYCLWLV